MTSLVRPADQSRHIDALQAKIESLERLSAQTQRLIDVKNIQGNNEAYSSTFGAQVGIYTNTVAGPPQDPFLFAYTPPVNVWWEVTLNMGIVQKIDAAYHYCYAIITLTPADEAGAGSGYQLVTQHSQVNQFEARAITRAFKLTAGVAYTIQATASPGGGSWNYYHGPNHLWMTAKAFTR